MQPAADKLAIELQKVDFHDAKIPVIANVTAKKETKVDEIRELLVQQAAHPVMWESSVRTMLADEAGIFIEVGPGKVLTGMLRRIDKKRIGLNVEDEESLEKTLAYLKEVR
jgi:[acyl-carrier-protein] S-malonyltransferase